MSQPVKLSDSLVLDARLAAEPLQRSIAGQVEFWARLGRSVDLVLEGHQVLRLAQNGETRPLSESIAEIGTPAGRIRLNAYLESEPYPHFKPHPTRPDVLKRIEEDGTHAFGRFVEGNWTPEPKRTPDKAKIKKPFNALIAK